MKPVIALATLAAAALALPALAAPKLDNLVVKPAGKGPDVEVSVSIARTRFDTGNCDARVDFGDGQGRNLEFGIAQTRTAKHTYKKNGSYSVSVKGSGATPCEGTRQAPVSIAGVVEPKKAEPKKADAKKKPEPKKKSEPTKKKGEGKKKADEKGKGKKKADEKKKDDKK